MIISKDKQGNWTTTAGGTGTFIGTKAAFDAIKDTLPNNTVAYITDDGNGDLQPVDAITNGDMHPVTSNAVYDLYYKKAAVTCSSNLVTIVDAFYTSGHTIDVFGYIPSGTQLTFSGNQTKQLGTLQISGKTLLGKSIASLFLYVPGGNPITAPAVWKCTNDAWCTSSYNDTTITLGEDSYFNTTLYI